MSNSEDPDFVSGIKDKLLTIGKNLKNLVHLRRIKEAKVLNPAVLMGLTSASEDDLMRIWGMDPVYPSKTAYTNMAVSIMDEIESVTVLNSRILSSGATVHGPRTATPTSGGRRITARENCTSGSQTIVERRDTGPPPQKKKINLERSKPPWKRPRRPWRTRGWPRRWTSVPQALRRLPILSYAWTT